MVLWEVAAGLTHHPHWGAVDDLAWDKLAVCSRPISPSSGSALGYVEHEEHCKNNIPLAVLRIRSFFRSGKLCPAKIEFDILTLCMVLIVDKAQVRRLPLIHLIANDGGVWGSGARPDKAPI